MNPPSEDFKDVLAAAGVGVFGAQGGWGIYIGTEPERPQATITLYDTGGFEPDPARLLDKPTVLIRVRGEPGGYQAAFAKAAEVRDALLGLPSQTLGGAWYVGVWVTGDIGFVSNDDHDRPVFTMSLRAVREPAAGGGHREAL